jgi:hypothetical protein
VTIVHLPIFAGTIALLRLEERRRFRLIPFHAKFSDYALVEPQAVCFPVGGRRVFPEVAGLTANAGPAGNLLDNRPVDTRLQGKLTALKSGAAMGWEGRLIAPPFLVRHQSSSEDELDDELELELLEELDELFELELLDEFELRLELEFELLLLDELELRLEFQLLRRSSSRSRSRL